MAQTLFKLIPNLAYRGYPEMFALEKIPFPSNRYMRPRLSWFHMNYFIQSTSPQIKILFTYDSLNKKILLNASAFLPY